MRIITTDTKRGGAGAASRRRGRVASPLKPVTHHHHHHHPPRSRGTLRCRCRPSDDVAIDMIAKLRSELSDAIDEERYARAAEIRDEINTLSESSRVQVMEANAAFYKAFESGSIKAMRNIWGHGNHVRVIHPGAGCIIGRDQVLASWDHVFQVGGYQIELADVSLHFLQDVAFVTCVELVDSGATVGKVVATNVFERQEGEWRIVHHHGSPTAQ